MDPTHTSSPLPEVPANALCSQGEECGCADRQVCVLHCSFWLTQEEAVLKGFPRAQPGLMEVFKNYLILFSSWNWADAGDCHYARPGGTELCQLFVSDTLVSASFVEQSMERVSEQIAKISRHSNRGGGGDMHFSPKHLFLVCKKKGPLLMVFLTQTCILENSKS